MKLIFRSKDFASIESVGLGFNNRRPMSTPWHYQGRIQHPAWQGSYQCHWEQNQSAASSPANQILWTVQGDARLFGLAAALKARGIVVDVEQE